MLVVLAATELRALSARCLRAARLRAGERGAMERGAMERGEACGRLARGLWVASRRGSVGFLRWVSVDC